MREPAPSFRDPAGCCCSFQNRVLRRVAAPAVPEFEAFLQTGGTRRLIAEKKLISTRRLDERETSILREASELKNFFAAASSAAVYEHERIAFPSYAHEWPPEMLWDAGRLTLELAQAAGADGFGLKDATPHNLLFRGSEPVFVDALSFERRQPGDPLWLPEAQFARTFLLPLMANRRWGLPLAEIFTSRRDGLEPEDVYRWCGPLEKFQPRLLSLVSIPPGCRAGPARMTRRFISRICSRTGRRRNSFSNPCSNAWGGRCTHSGRPPAKVRCGRIT
jgi:hypothetical protein